MEKKEVSILVLMFLKPLLKELLFKKNNYLKRHSVNEDWNYINPGSLSAGKVWGDSNNIQENLMDYMKEFNIKLQ